MVLLTCRVEDVEKLEKSPLIAKDIPIYGVIYHTEVRSPMELTFRQRSTRQSKLFGTSAIVVVGVPSSVLIKHFRQF